MNERPQRIVVTEHYLKLRKTSLLATAQLAELGLKHRAGRFAYGSSRPLYKAYPDGLALPSFASESVDGVFMTDVLRVTDSGELVSASGVPSRGTLLGSLAEIFGGCEVAVAVGHRETLSAAERYQHAVILGCVDAAHFAVVAAAAALRTRMACGMLRLVVPDSTDGIAVATEVAQDALKLGLKLHASLEIVDTGAHRTLNEYMRNDARHSKGRAR